MALTVSSPKVWEVLSLLSLTSFRVFDPQLTIQEGLLLICKQQPWFVFIAPVFSLMPEGEKN